jgi:hypothetical protein
MVTQNVHNRINYRANQVAKAKAYGNMAFLAIPNKYVRSLTEDYEPMYQTPILYDRYHPAGFKTL